ncbi:MAG: VWA domain-containing protein [Vicinamibacteria bacterium]|nr:VWA domain-containing protein [Vicinamibacteria bacterium]
MLHVAVAALLLFQGVEPRTLSLWATDPETGAPAEGLTAAEVAILEDGRVVEGLVVRRDDRPLVVALVLDSSESIADKWRTELQVAAIEFVRGLPDGAKVGVWTTGDRARRVVEFSVDRDKIVKAIEKTFPLGANSMLDGLVEAAKELRKQPGDRSALVAVSGAGFGFSDYTKDLARDRVQANAMVTFGVLFDEGLAAGALGGRTFTPGARGELPAGRADSDNFSRVGRGEHEYVMIQGARRSGGLFQAIPSSQGVKDALAKVNVALRSQYLLSYKSLPNPHERRTEVRTARPLTVRLGPSSVEEPGGR